MVVSNAQLGDDQRAQIEDIVQRKTGVNPEQIVITSANGQTDTGEQTQSSSDSDQTVEEEQTESGETQTEQVQE
ncbi:MAG: SpoIIIAH-like family protein [Blautia sp.]